MPQNTKEKIKYWLQIFLIPIYGLSFLFPRSKSIWLFGSTFGRRFAENPRYLYLYLNQNKDLGLRPVWISHKKGIVSHLREHQLEAYYYHSLKGYWYCLRGGVYLYDNYSKDISFWLSGGAMKVNLWHGVGNKKINFDNKFDTVRHPKNKKEAFQTFLRRMSDEKPHHYTLATSETMAKIFAGAFRTDDAHILVEGYPRNDALFEGSFSDVAATQKEREAISYLEQNKEKKIFFYMPTFRDSEEQFFDIMDLEAFQQYLQENNYLFVAKLHPKSKMKAIFAKLQYENIYHVEAEVDPYCLLGYADVLITDYSSVYSDFMLTEKPVIGFFYDYETYTMNTREGYFDFEEYMPERKAKTMEELMAAMKQILIADVCKEARMKSRKIMFANADNQSCYRLTRKIQKLLEGKK